MAGPERIQRIDVPGRVADDLEQLLGAPDVAGKRRDIEIPDEQGGQGERLGPARHPLDEIELLPEFGIERAIGDVAAGGHVDVLDPHPVRRSEEHTSELQSLMRISYAVFRLKKKNKPLSRIQIQ